MARGNKKNKNNKQNNKQNTGNPDFLPQSSKFRTERIQTIAITPRKDQEQEPFTHATKNQRARNMKEITEGLANMNISGN